MTTRDKGAKALYDAYNAGGDPATANKNYRGEPCPDWADLPDNVREKWACAYDAALALEAVTVLNIVDDDDDDDDDQSDTTWGIEWPKGINFIPRHPPVELANFIIEQNLAGLPWRYGDDSEDISVELADGIWLYADFDDFPRVTVVVNGEPDNDAKTAGEVLTFLNNSADDYADDHYTVNRTQYCDAAFMLFRAMRKTAALRASRTKTSR